MEKNFSNFEKIIFLELTNKQFAVLPNNDFYHTFNLLTEIEKQKYYSLNKEIHNIWSLINTKPIKNVMEYDIYTIEQYNQEIKPVSEIILQISKEFGITLKREISEDFKNALKRVLGQDYLNNFLDSIK